MRVEVLLFAQLRDALGADREFMELTEGARARDVMDRLRQRPGWVTVAKLPLRVAVNERLVDLDHVLGDGDRVVFLTPVSGG